MLSLQDYRGYEQNRVRYAENDFPLLRSKIRELHPVQRASLEALLLHFFRVASHSDQNGMIVEALASVTHYSIFRGNDASQESIYAKQLVMEDLIQNVHTLFEERPPPSPTVPSPNVHTTMSTCTYSSSFLSPDSPQPAEVQALDSTTRPAGIVAGTPTSTHPSLPSTSDAAVESRLTLPPTTLLSPLLGLSSSKTLTEGVEATTQEQAIPKAGTTAVETLPNSTPQEVVSLPAPTSVSEWRLHQSRLPSHPEALTTPHSPPESVPSSMSDFPLSSATSLQTGMRGLSL